MIEKTDLQDFSISKWYDKFSQISLETIVIDLPKQLIEKFQSDEIVDIEEEPYGKFVESVKNALNTLGNKAFIKNNWHAPIDARVFSFGNNLQATNVDDIMMFFTNSGVIQEDFSTARGVEFCLVLKKWINIHPAAEFRCIVINNVLRGITPRDWPTFYAHFKEEGPQIIEQLNNFFIENVKNRFPRKNYTFDVVFSYPDRPFILDFGMLNIKSRLYAFTWKEIQPLMDKECPEEVAPVFRYLETDYGIMTRTDALNRFIQTQS